MLRRTFPHASVRLRQAPFVLVPVLALFLAVPAHALDLSSVPLTATLGADYSNGNYGTANDTNAFVAMTTLSARLDNFTTTVSLPYLRVAGAGLVTYDALGNPVVVDQTGRKSRVRDGLGDLGLSETYTLPSAALDDFDIELTGRVKLPTASATRRLGTGVTDVGFSIDVSKQYGDWEPFVTLGYLLPGSSDPVHLKNTYSASVGSSYQINDHLVAIVSYNFDSASTDRVQDSDELFGSLSWVFNDKLSLTGFATAGLSDGGPLDGGGVFVSYKLN